MTTRAWFRLQRAALWARDPQLAADIDRVALACLADNPPINCGRCGRIWWIADIEHYLERERVIALVRADMDEAMRRLLRRTQYGKDLTA